MQFVLNDTCFVPPPPKELAAHRKSLQLVLGLLLLATSTRKGFNLGVPLSSEKKTLLGSSSISMVAPAHSQRGGKGRFQEKK